MVNLTIGGFSGYCSPHMSWSEMIELSIGEFCGPRIVPFQFVSQRSSGSAERRAGRRVSRWHPRAGGSERGGGGERPGGRELRAAAAASAPARPKDNDASPLPFSDFSSSSSKMKFRGTMTISLGPDIVVRERGEEERAAATARSSWERFCRPSGESSRRELTLVAPLRWSSLAPSPAAATAGALLYLSAKYLSRRRRLSIAKSEATSPASSSDSGPAEELGTDKCVKCIDVLFDDDAQADAGSAPAGMIGWTRDNNRSTKREAVLPWDDYFMAVAVLSSYRSKDPNRQVGACIVNPTKRIVGIGYNGFPVGCGDDALPWGRGTPGGSSLDTKYPYVCHAEMNAIMNKNCESLDGCKMYVTLFPCNECAKLIIQSRVTEVVYCSDRYHATESMTASRRMLSLANVKTRRFSSTNRINAIDFNNVDPA